MIRIVPCTAIAGSGQGVLLGPLKVPSGRLDRLPKLIEVKTTGFVRTRNQPVIPH